MKGTPAIYLGRIVDKAHFRVFVYGANGQKKLVESWEAFEDAMQSGVWFASVDDMEHTNQPIEASQESKTQSKPIPRARNKAEKMVDSANTSNSGVFEVTNES